MQPNRFTLHRLILIDSYTEGRITELPLCGGTAITGRNGRGKTSLLQLIPAFYGERPDNIVQPVSNKKSFARYYLPRATSYVIFEYQRDDVPCCSILYADESGEAVQYRFMRSGYRRELFVHPDGSSIVMSSQLASHLKQNGVFVSRKQSWNEYRSIIQGKLGQSKDRAWQRQMIADFAFCPTSRPLTHIERIVSGMFMRRTNFSDLQKMVVSSVTESESERNPKISLGAERKKIEAWPDVYDSYTAVMTEGHRMTSIQTCYDMLLAAEGELRTIHARFVLLDSHLGAELVKATGRLEKEKEDLKDAEQAHLAALRDLQGGIEQADRDCRFGEGEIQRLQSENTRYEREKVKEKAELISRELEISEARGQLERRQEILIGQQGNIDREYQTLLGNMERDHLRRQPDFHQEREKVMRTQGERLAELERQRDVALDQLQEAAKPELERVAKAMEEASVQLGQAKAQVQNPQPEPAVVEAQERQALATVEARQRWHEALEGEKLANQALHDAKAQFSQAEQQLNRIRAQIQTVEAQLTALRLQASPGEASVLYTLRTQRPDWTQDIAKVLREDLLLRTDLSPVLGEIEESIYGLQLNLDLLETPVAADEAALQREIEGKLEILQQLKTQSEAQELRLEALSEARQKASEDAELKGREVASARITLSSAEASEKNAVRAVRASREAAKQVADKAFADAQEALEEAKDALAQRQAQLQTALNDARTDHAGAVQAAQQAAQNEIKAISDREKAANDNYRDAKAQIEAERSEKLKAAGVDTAVLKELEAQLLQCKEQLETIAGTRNLVAEWRLWLNAHWSKLPEHQAALRQAQATAATLKERKAEAERQWRGQAANRKQAIDTLSQQVNQLNDERNRVQARRSPLEAYAPDPDTLGLPYDPAWTLQTLVHQANGHQQAVREHHTRLATDIQAIKAVFVARRDTPPEHYYDTHRQQMGPDRAEHVREWVPVLKAWYATEHETYRNLLRVEARTIAEAVGDFHGRMRSFHLRVQQFNRELQESLNANLGFESIGGVSIEIVSSIKELQYWSTIEKVADSRIAWMGGDPSVLPPPEFAASLRELLQHWQLKEGINAELTHLIGIRGEVVENGNRRPFKTAQDLETISSHGLSYIVLVLIFIGFINRIRGKAPVNVVWALDEIKDLDVGNVELLMDILAKNNITLVSACPDPDPDVLALFRNRCSIRADRCIYDTSDPYPVTPTGAPSPMDVDHV